jgi:hypothetical protein
MVSATDVEDGFMSEVQQRPGWWQAAESPLPHVGG